MTSLFWGTATVMALIASAFVLWPLIFARQSSLRLGTAAAVFIPLGAIGLYAVVGTPEAIGEHVARSGSTSPQNTARSSRPADRQKKIGSVESLLQGLEKRVDDNPEDASSWQLLARSYEHLGRPADAETAFAEARRLRRTDTIPAATKTPAPAGGATALHGMLQVSDAARAKINETDTIFVFAKQSPEQRMPLAAIRRTATNLPMRFSLTDAAVLTPGTSLADFEEIYVTASISHTGMATEPLDGIAVTGATVKSGAFDSIALHIETSAEFLAHNNGTGQ